MVDQEDKEIKRILPVDLSELEIAFTTSGYEMDYYLDIETGEVLSVTEEAQRELENFYDEGAIDPDGELPESEDPPEEYEIPDWQWDMIKTAHRVEKGYGTRCISVPKTESSEGYRDMEDFADGVENEVLRKRLLQALDKKRPFRQFKDVLLNYPEDRQRWFDFQHNRTMERILDWLDYHGIKPVMDQPGP